MCKIILTVYCSIPNRTGTCGHRNHTKLENLELLDLSNNKLKSLIVCPEVETAGQRLGSSSSITQSVSLLIF